MNNPEIAGVGIQKPELQSSIFNKIRQGVGRIGLALSLSVGGGVATSVAYETARPEVAAAETGGYPLADAPCYPRRSEMNNNIGKCADYDWRNPTRDSKGNITGWPMWTSRGYGARNCTDYAAWKVGQYLGTTPTGMGNGNQWDERAADKGYIKTSSPEPGDAAVWNAGSYGHVAFVESVNSDGTVNISEYNKSELGSYETRNNVRADVYVDFDGIGINKYSGTTTSATTPPPPPPRTVTVGSYNPGNGMFYLRDSNDSGPAGVAFQYGNANWVPIAGDWDNNGTMTAGVYDPNTSTFHLRNSHSSGPADTSFQYGNIGWKPIAGDWDGNGYWSVGLQDPNSSTFYLKNYNGPGSADYTFGFGNGGWLPIAGDWDGRDDGNPATTIGVYNPNTATFYLNNENDSSPAEKTIQYGNIGWTAIAGDWDGNSFASIGSYNPNTATFYLKNENSQGPADVTVQYGNAGWKPLPGDWNAG